LRAGGDRREGEWESGGRDAPLVTCALERRRILAGIVAAVLAFSVARRRCDDGERMHPPWPPLFKGGKLGAINAAGYQLSFERRFSGALRRGDAGERMHPPWPALFKDLRGAVRLSGDAKTDPPGTAFLRGAWRNERGGNRRSVDRRFARVCFLTCRGWADRGCCAWARGTDRGFFSRRRVIGALQRRGGSNGDGGAMDGGAS
jgi:hypothetical protein